MTMKSSRKRKTAVTDRTSPETSPAADLIANNVDLLTQILLRTSAKSLIRFKSVSKHWLSLISDSRFASSHSRLNPKPLISSLYFYYEKKLESVSLNGSPTIPPLSFLPALTGEFKILHSCNGLLLIRNAQIVDDRDYGKVRYIVCNPTTQKYSVLTQRFYESGVLAFDPSKSPHYKVVLLTYIYSVPPSSEMDIYSSETACWRRIFLVDRSLYEDGAFWNRAIYWLCDQYNLLRFDVETEKMVWIPYAESGSRILPPYKTRYFGECGRGGRLILIQSYSDSAAGFKIREMDKDYCRWNVKFRVNLRPLISAFPEIEGKNYKFPFMCVVEGEKKDDLALILAIPGKVISYNLKKKTWNVLRDLASGEFLSEGYGIFPFVESLSPVWKCPKWWSSCSFC